MRIISKINSSFGSRSGGFGEKETENALEYFSSSSNLRKQADAKQPESAGGIRFVSGVRQTPDGIDDIQPSVVRRQSEPDVRRVTERDEGDAHSAAVDVQLSDDVGDEVQQVTVFGLADRRRIVHHEHHVHPILTIICSQNFECRLPTFYPVSASQCQSDHQSQI